MGLFGNFFSSKQLAPPCAVHASDKTLVRDEDVAWWNGFSLDDCKMFEKRTSRPTLLPSCSSRKTVYQKRKQQRKFAAASLNYYWTLEQRDDEHFNLLASDAKLPIC